jgi:hypothetical protein
MKTTRQGILVMMALLMVTAMGLLTPETASAEPIIVNNSSTPSEGTEVLKLQEVWRAGGDDDEDYFGVISQVVIGEDGNIYLLDTRLSEVPVYSSDGERLATLSREGDGPGETRIPSNLLFMPDGNLGLVQVFPGKVTKIDQEGNPQGIFQVEGGVEGGFMMFFDCQSQGENLVVTGELISTVPPAGQLRRNFVSSYNAEGVEQVNFFEKEFNWNFMDFSLDEGEFTRPDFRKVVVGQDGRVYVVPSRNEYTILVYLPDGTHERTIKRDFEHRMRTAEEKSDIMKTLELQFQQIPNAKLSASDWHPDIGGLQIGPKGNIWVGSSRSGVDQPEGIIITWDVFNPDGKFIKQLSLKGDGDGEQDAFFPVKGGGFVQVTGFTEAITALQNGGQAGSEEDVDDEAEPMKVIFHTAD